MRIAVTTATLLFALASCSTTEHTVSPYQQPNSLMSSEINQRIDQIPFQHREELVQNLLWLTQTGEQTIPALLRGLKSENPKVRSSCCWVLGRLRDRRTVNDLRELVSDNETSVRLEAARTLVLMGDLDQSPKQIEGLDSERKEVRYMCHEALKSATGHDFGYDHLNANQKDLQLAVLRWRQWWGEYGGDTFFAASYEQANGLNNVAAPGGETKLNDAPQEQPQPQKPEAQQPEAPQPEAQNQTVEAPAGSEKPVSPQTGAGNRPAVIPSPDHNAATGTEQVTATGQSSEAKQNTGTEQGHQSAGSAVEVPTQTEVPVVVPPATGSGNGGN